MKSGRPCQYDLVGMYQAICEHPGIHKKVLMAQFEVKARDADTVLQAFEAAGIVLSEDAHGGLYPFDRWAWGLTDERDQ